MKRLFGSKKDVPPPPSLQDTTDNLNKRGDSIDEKIRKLDAELVRYKEQLKKTRPGPTQNSIKQRAMRVLKQKKMYEGQRDQLYNQTYNLEQISFTQESLKDTQHMMTAMKTANKELKKQYKTMDINKIEAMQDEMYDMMDEAGEIQEAMSRTYGVPDGIDEDELQDELDALDDDFLEESNGEASYLGNETTSIDNDLAALPSAPSGTNNGNVSVDEYGLPVANDPKRELE